MVMFPCLGSLRRTHPHLGRPASGSLVPLALRRDAQRVLLGPGAAFSSAPAAACTSPLPFLTAVQLYL